MKNNKKAAVSTVVVIVVVLLVALIIGLFLPKNFFSNISSKTGSKSFSTFKMNSGTPKDATPGPLKWKKSFAYEKDKNKKGDRGGQSYIKFLTDKNKK